MNCDWEPSESGGVSCIYCRCWRKSPRVKMCPVRSQGYKVDVVIPPEKGRRCTYRSPPLDEIFPPPAGLGDYVSTALHSFGLTKERFSKLVTLGKTEEGCNCNGRHAIANWVGERLGLAPGRLPELHDLLLAEEMQPQKVCHCSHFDAKCLPILKVDRELPLAQAIQKAGYQLCQGCPKFLAADPVGPSKTEGKIPD